MGCMGMRPGTKAVKPVKEKRKYDNGRHRELCHIAGRYLRSQGIQPFHRCQYVVVELERASECPDAFGFGSCSTQLIEVKVSRSDFLSDRNKYWRQNPQRGLGTFRSYLCPEGMISVEELPPKWGLLYVGQDGAVTKIKDAEAQDSSPEEELNLLRSLMRRAGIKPQLFSFKNYKSDRR